MITYDARFTQEIKSRIAMVKVAFSRKKILFPSSLDCMMLKPRHFGK
jgi:hypothetical protein